MLIFRVGICSSIVAESVVVSVSHSKVLHEDGTITVTPSRNGHTFIGDAADLPALADVGSEVCAVLHKNPGRSTLSYLCMTGPDVFESKTSMQQVLDKLKTQLAELAEVYRNRKAFYKV